MSIEEGLREYARNDTTHVFIGGALSDHLLRQLLFSGAGLSEIKLVVSDASKILVSSDNYRKLRVKGCDIQVLDDVNLLAVTVNPFSVYGHSFDKDRFRERLSERIKAPVFNVRDV